jgi:hypothetical protein
MEFELWVLIPILGILTGAFREWLRFSAKQRALGASTTELEKDVATLAKTVEAQRERLQNLEAIVVSQTWDAVHDRVLSPAEKELKIASVAHRELSAPDPGAVNQRRAEQLARRLGS